MTLRFARHSSLRRSAVTGLSLVALVASSVALLGDSADCTDGYDAYQLDADYTTTCPTSMALARGRVHVDIGESDEARGYDLTGPFTAGGIRASKVFDVIQSHGDRCSVGGFIMRFERDSTHPAYDCERVATPLGAPVTVECRADARSGYPSTQPSSSSSANPPLRDASSDADDASADASSTDTGTDASPDATVDASVAIATHRDVITPRDDIAQEQAPDRCTFTFAPAAP